MNKKQKNKELERKRKHLVISIEQISKDGKKDKKKATPSATNTTTQRPLQGAVIAPVLLQKEVCKV